MFTDMIGFQKTQMSMVLSICQQIINARLRKKENCLHSHIDMETTQIIVRGKLKLRILQEYLFLDHRITKQ